MSRLQKKANLIGTIESLLDAVGAEEKIAMSGETSHPADSVDDGTQPAVEGARSSENEADTKAEPNRGLSVNEASEGSSESQEDIQSDASVNASSTGEDPSIETGSVKTEKDDPGSEHPARTDNDAVDSEKYASPAATLRALAKKAEAIGSEICSIIAVDGNYKASESDEEDSEESKEDYEESDDDSDEDDSEDKEAAALGAAQAGYDLAGVFGGIDMPVEDKQAADAMVVDTIENVLGLAAARADKCAEFYSEHFKAAYAEEEMIPEELEDAVSDSVVAETSDDIEDEAAEEAPIDEAALLDLLAGGEDMGAEEVVEDMAGEELGGALGAELGGEPGLGGEEDLAMLEAVLAELGVAPEELEVAAAQKIAANKTTTDWRPKVAGDQEKYAKMKAVIQELVGRSR